jgi:hypothetical protein
MQSTQCLDVVLIRWCLGFRALLDSGGTCPTDVCRGCNKKDPGNSAQLMTKGDRMLDEIIILLAISLGPALTLAVIQGRRLVTFRKFNPLPLPLRVSPVQSDISASQVNQCPRIATSVIGGRTLETLHGMASSLPMNSVKRLLVVTSAGIP